MHANHRHGEMSAYVYLTYCHEVLRSFGWLVGFAREYLILTMACLGDDGWEGKGRATLRRRAYSLLDVIDWQRRAPSLHASTTRNEPLFT